MNYVSQVALPLSLAFIMFAMGLGLTRADFVRVFQRPREFLLGAALQILVLPIVALLLTTVWPLPPELAVGIMLLAACPGGTTSNLLTHMARGDVALSISLTAVISVGGMLTIPFILGFALDRFMAADAPPLPLAKTVISIFLITTVPVLIGMFVRARRPKFAQWAEPRSRLLVTLLFVVIVVAALASERELLWAHFDETAVVVSLLNAVTLLIAFGAATVAGLGHRQRSAITLECGLQNGTLAVVIATSMLNNTKFGVPAALYALPMFTSATLFAIWSARKERVLR